MSISWKLSSHSGFLGFECVILARLLFSDNNNERNKRIPWGAGGGKIGVILFVEHMSNFNHGLFFLVKMTYLSKVTHMHKHLKAFVARPRSCKNLHIH